MLRQVEDLQVEGKDRRFYAFSVVVKDCNIEAFINLS